MTTTASANSSSGSTPIATPRPSWKLAISSAPACSLRLSAVKSSSRPFWMMTERPKVTSSGGRNVVAERVVEHAALQRVAEQRHQRHDDDEARSGWRPSAATTTSAR